MRYCNLLIIKSLIFISCVAPLSSLAAQNDSAKNVAKELNSLYARTADCSDGKPSYYCSGVILRGQYFTKDIPEPWYMNPNRDAASYSYIRSDITALKGFALYFSTTTGLILTPLDEVKNVNQFEYKPLCFIPWDGFTRDSSSCKGGSDPNLDGICGDLGIVTLSQFFAKYLDPNPKQFAPGTSSQVSCAFSMDYEGFKLGMSVDKYIYRDHPDLGLFDGDESAAYNELLVKTWPKDSVPANQVPIKAIFVMIDDGGKYVNFAKSHGDTPPDPLTSAFSAADAYKKETNKEIPVVTLDMKKLQSGATDIFAPAIRPNNPKSELKTT